MHEHNDKLELMHDWDQKTVIEQAKDLIRDRLHSGPLPSQALFAALYKKGFARTTIERAKRSLVVGGEIVVSRHGARSNPYTVKLVE